MAESDNQHVLIIGAGITGLLIAHGLAQSGIPHTIFEAEDASTSRLREWTMGIHWAVPLLEELLPPKFRSRLSEACVDKSLDYITPPQNGARIYDGVTGEVLKELVSVGKLLRASRRKLRKLCAEGVDVRYGHVLEEISCDNSAAVTATFTNGVQAKGTVLVGCDGPRSTVRSFLFPAAEAVATPMNDMVSIGATFSYGDAEKARFIRTTHPVWCMQLHPDLFTYVCIQDVPDPEKPENWQYFLMWNWLGEVDKNLTNAERMALLKGRAANIAEPFRSAALWIPDDVELRASNISYWVAKKWDSNKGRVTLAGDAAHPMPPHRGQGLNHAIQDAHNFVKTMKRILDFNDSDDAQAEVVQAYSDEVATRGAEEVLMSKKNAYMLVQYEEAKNSPYMKHGLNKQDGGSGENKATS